MARELDVCELTLVLSNLGLNLSQTVTLVFHMLQYVHHSSEGCIVVVPGFGGEDDR